MHFKNYLQRKIERTIVQLWPQLKEHPISIDISYPPEDKFGDYSSNVAMQLTPIAHQSPLDIAEKIVKALGNMPAIRKVEVVPPGFINFYFDDKWLNRQVATLLKEKQHFAKSEDGAGKRVLIEFVSANPTGPLTVANGRGAFAGDTLANVMKLAGYRVKREYYVNDVGNQVAILAESVLRKYWIAQGIKMEYPDYCYQGEYVTDLARRINLPNYKLQNVEKIEVVKDKIKGRILQRMVSDIKKILTKRLGITYDNWFSEKSLYTSGQVDRMLAQLKERGLLYKSEGAIWLRTKRFGDDKDRVLIKANEEPVYFLSDIAYHHNKMIRRKYDIAIDIFGADHHGYVGRLQSVMKIFEIPGRLDIILAQLVRLMKKGQELKMSKRSGTFVTLEELVDDVGADAARFFFLMYDFNTHMDFDMDLAKRKSKDNPVYYVQYAHARICSILRKAEQLEIIAAKRGAVVLEPTEIGLIKELLKWPELITEVAQSYQVHRLPTYATSLATKFHEFYTQERVIRGKQVDERRLNLIKATKLVLAHVLSTMGISAPERM